MRVIADINKKEATSTRICTIHKHEIAPDMALAIRLELTFELMIAELRRQSPPIRKRSDCRF